MTLDAELLAIVRLLANYLRQHPLAADTAEGIARWWLQESARIKEGDLAQALEWMQAHGLVERVGAADGRVRYRRRPEVADLDLALRVALKSDYTGAAPNGST